MIILHLNDPGVKRALQLPELKGLKRLARGTFCAVYDKGATVMKLTADRHQFDFGADIYGPKGEHFATVTHSESEVGETSSGLGLHLMEAEKLDKLSTGDAALRKLGRKLVKEMNESYTSQRMSSRGGDAMKMASVVACAHTLKQDWLPASLKEAIEDLEAFFCNFGGSLDIHGANLMRRDDCLILNDVVVDHDVLTRKRAVQLSNGGYGLRI